MLVVIFMSEEVTAVIEEYLESVYRLQQKSGVARTTDIVKLLKVAPGTVTNTVKKLEREGLVKHEPYKGVKLTEKGRKIALQVLRKHRLSECLLTDLLRVDWDKAHKVACRLEHALDKDLVKKLENALGHPRTCPHGNPIPTESGEILKEKSQPMTTLKEGEQGIIVRIADEDTDLCYFNALGLVPGNFIEIVEKGPSGEPITVKVGEATHALSHNMALNIQVKKT
jgi:DtxR family Mn-dependent transcriptional regulator